VRTSLRRRLSRGGRPEVPDWIDPEFARRADLMARLDQVTTEEQSIAGTRRMLQPFWGNVFVAAHPGGHGLPMRTLFPFFDLRLVRCVLEMPPFPWRQRKRLLREAMGGLLPEAVRERPKRPLYVPPGGVDANDPWYKLALRPEVRRWRRELVSTPGMARFIDLERALDLIDSPSPPTGMRGRLDTCLPLAEWLRHQRRSFSPSHDVAHLRDTTAA
jgi:asparagine synthase (glutamine-hydrolysing)